MSAGRMRCRPEFPEDAARDLVSRALDEDHGAGGDLTTRTLVPRGTRATGAVVAREPLVACGVPVAALVFDAMRARGTGPVAVIDAVADGTTVPRAGTLFALAGDAWAILGGERVLLNVLARLCGIATLTAACVAEVHGTAARIADTRKTTPGLRALEKYAVATGGGENHRPALDALILAKDNHKLLAGGIPGVVSALRAAGIDPATVEIEVDSLDEFDLALAAGAGWILVDNMDPESVREAVRRAAGRARIEASGGLRPGLLRGYAEAGADRLSLGLLTHGVRAVDIGLDFAPRDPA